MLNFGIDRTLANHVDVAYLAYMGEPPLAACRTPLTAFLGAGAQCRQMRI